MIDNPAPCERQHDGEWRPLHGALLLGCFFGLAWVPAVQSWPLYWIGPLTVYGIATCAIAPLRRSFRPWRFGTVTPLTVAAAIIIAPISCGVLFAFQAAAHPNLDDLRGLLPTVVRQHIVVAGFIFPIRNAALEEIVFRGILYDAIEEARGPWVAIISTSILFGYCHLHGYPPGPIGAALAGIYSVALGWLRARSGGLGLPVIVHSTADASIFLILLRAGILS